MLNTLTSMLIHINLLRLTLETKIHIKASWDRSMFQSNYIINISYLSCRMFIIMNVSNVQDRWSNTLIIIITLKWLVTTTRTSVINLLIRVIRGRLLSSQCLPTLGVSKIRLRGPKMLLLPIQKHIISEFTLGQRYTGRHARWTHITSHFALANIKQ